MITLKWHRRFLGLAQEISRWSRDPSTQVAAVAVDPESKRILSVGYNGFPAGIDDTNERLHNREIKYKLSVHAEMNVIFNATKLGVSLEGAYLYVWPLPVCEHCALGIIQAGIKTIVLPTLAFLKAEKWTESWQRSSELFREAGINTIEINTDHLDYCGNLLP